jgi:hypothetical protein
MFARRIVRILAAVAVVGALATASAGAFPTANRATYFTFSGAVQLPGVTLPRGTYIFEVANPDSRGDIVRVMSRDRSKLYLMQFTNLVHRPWSRNMKTAITLGETPSGTTPPVKAWYPENDTLGREFIYR